MSRRRRGPIDEKRRAALTARIEARKAELQARLDQRRPQTQRRRRWPWLLLLLLLLLLLCMRPCRCTPVPDGPLAEPEEEATGEGEAAESPPEPEPLTGHIDRTDRPAMPTPAPAPLTWIDAFRMQVAARGPRLAACFEGSAEPGTFKWTVLVEPVEGKVSDPTLEPTLGSAPLTQAQRACALEVLSTPAYHLDGGGERSTPSRVSMVIEF